MTSQQAQLLVTDHHLIAIFLDPGALHGSFSTVQTQVSLLKLASTGMQFRQSDQCVERVGVAAFRSILQTGANRLLAAV
ncbi:hypothetical protein D3C81_2153810 [compost metagenome]